MPTRPPPSIENRLARMLALWSLFWGLAVGVAIWLAAVGEVDELLDDALQSSADLIAVLVAAAVPEDPRSSSAAVAAVPPLLSKAPDRFAWQLVHADGQLLLRSALAPEAPWHAKAQPGFSQAGGWRLFGVALGEGARMLYVAQTEAERREAVIEVAVGAFSAALALGLMGYAWLRLRVRFELQPLTRLSQKLQRWTLGPEDAHDALGKPERHELQPVHEALGALAARLSTRIANERAFSAHAAHALRTPLAGIDAQLAVALRAVPEAQRERLLAVRGAAARLQGVVAALLTLFRSGMEVRLGAVDLAELVARIPAPALQVEVDAGAPLQADADLLAAALMNLIDNAQRHGARTVQVSQPQPGWVRVRDDGPGVDAAHRAALRAELLAPESVDESTQGPRVGLGLALANRVARVHGGALHVPDLDAGFAVDLQLTAQAAPSAMPSER